MRFNSLVGRVFLLEFICNLCSQTFLNFRTMKLHRGMKFNGKHFNPNSMMNSLLHRGVYFPNLFFKEKAHAKFGGV